MIETPNPDSPTRTEFRRAQDKLVGILLAVLGFVLSTAVTGALLWVSSVSGRVQTLETRSAVIESTINQISSDVKEIKADLKARPK